MNLEIGVVCGRCDTYSPIRTGTCPSCGNELALFKDKAEKAIPQSRSTARIAPRDAIGTPPPENPMGLFESPRLNGRLQVWGNLRYRPPLQHRICLLRS